MFCVCACMLQPPCPMTPNSSAASTDSNVACGACSSPAPILLHADPRLASGLARLPLACGLLWILVVRFLPSTGRSPVGTLEQHRDSAGPGRQLTTVSALGWPLARPWGGSPSRFRRCRRRWPSAGPGSACGRGGMLGLDRETPGFHPEAVLVLIPRAPN